MEHPCNTTFHEKVCVEAKVRISPKAELGEVRSFCVDEPVICACPKAHSDECIYFLRQMICMEIPVEFSAKASVGAPGIICDIPERNPCNTMPDEENEETPDDDMDIYEHHYYQRRYERNLTPKQKYPNNMHYRYPDNRYQEKGVMSK